MHILMLVSFLHLHHFYPSVTVIYYEISLLLCITLNANRKSRNMVGLALRAFSCLVPCLVPCLARYYAHLT